MNKLCLLIYGIFIWEDIYRNVNFIDVHREKMLNILKDYNWIVRLSSLKICKIIKEFVKIKIYLTSTLILISKMGQMVEKQWTFLSHLFFFPLVIKKLSKSLRNVRAGETADCTLLSTCISFWVCILLRPAILQL